jgi:putative flippase GtrA
LPSNSGLRVSRSDRRRKARDLELDVRQGSLYVLFAAVATIANLAMQEVTFRVIPILPFSVSILSGTAAGFIVKYVLDKNLVFSDPYTGGRHEIRKISLYALLSVATTVVFWAFEVAFWFVWRTDQAKYVGALVGLAIGYSAKFALDRAFVFTDRRA